MKQPNILFAIADDASHFGVYGHSFVHTPTVDEIAKEGVIFNAAFTPNPKCAPSRACILTGRHTWTLEDACTHFCEFPAGLSLYPDLLEDAGYHVGYTGKGWGPGDYAVNGYKRNPAGNEYNKKELVPPEGSCIATVDYAENFKDFLADRKDGQPFCFWYGCREPHRKYNEGEGVRGGKDPAQVNVPSYLPDCETVRSDFCDYAFEIDWFDAQLAKLVAHLKAIGEYDNTLIIVTSDNGCPFPRVKGQMYEQDMRLPLCMSWAGHIKAGRHVDDLVSFIDFAPTFLELAGVTPPEKTNGRSLLPLMLAEESGIIDRTRNRVYMGRERHDMGRRDDRGYPVRCIRTPQYLYSRNFEPSEYPAGNPETGYTNCDPSPTKREILLRHAENDNYFYRLSFGLRPGEELFDIVNDPECMKNLAREEAYQEIKETLWQELCTELARTGDPRILADGAIFDTYPYTGAAPHAWHTLEKEYWSRAKKDEV